MKNVLILGKYQTYPSLDISIILSVLTVSVVLHLEEKQKTNNNNKLDTYKHDHFSLFIQGDVVALISKLHQFTCETSILRFSTAQPSLWMLLDTRASA